MKIEMGESLMQSWTKHIKKCQIATLNWKCSKSWESYNQQEIDTLIQNMKAKFSENVFGDSKNAQIISQAELDVLGISFDNNMIKDIYAIDIAFHGNGLGYSRNQKKDNVRQITKKMLRSALVLYSVFNLKTGNIIFASPKVQPADIEPLKNRFKEIEEFMKNEGFDFKFFFFCNEDFYQQILQPLEEIDSKCSDTSELCMRSFEIFAMCNDYRNQIDTVSEPTSVKLCTSVSTPRQRSASWKPQKEFFMHGRECSGKEFEAYLRATKSCCVSRTLFYQNKPEVKDVWHVNNFGEHADLNGNLASGPLRDWQGKQITGIKLEIK